MLPAKVIMFSAILGLAVYLKTSNADTIDHYMNIASQIPAMEIKANDDAQTWARSARTVLLITSETIAQTLELTNNLARKKGHPLFCMPSKTKLDGTLLDEIIQSTFEQQKNALIDNPKTVSEVALMGLQKQYPCAD